MAIDITVLCFVGYVLPLCHCSNMPLHDTHVIAFTRHTCENCLTIARKGKGYGIITEGLLREYIAL
jgi:hypothetical protein